jgi:hypothetical protein
MRLKLQSAEKQLIEESAKLEDLTLKLVDLDSARECNKMWITSPKEQIRLMCRGQGVTGRHVSMDECDEAPSGSDAIFFIRPCPVCGKHFKRKAFCVTTCGCMYHLFCLGAHLELFKSSTCVGRTCKEVFGEDMIELFGYHQHIIDLTKPKLERT